VMNNHRIVCTFSIVCVLNVYTVNGYNIFVLAIIIVNLIGDITLRYYVSCIVTHVILVVARRVITTEATLLRGIFGISVVTNMWVAIDIYFFENVDIFFKEK